MLAGLAFLGEFMTATGRVVAEPRRLRGTALVNQLDLIVLRGVPIMALISFLVGASLHSKVSSSCASSGRVPSWSTSSASSSYASSAFCSRRSCRLLRVRFHGELGSMKMREEIDAIRVMGLDPMEVLIIPACSR